MDRNILRIVSCKLEDHEVGLIWQVVSAAEGEVGRVGLAHGSVGELRRWMREDIVPPVEEAGWIALLGDWVVSRTMTCRYCEAKLDLKNAWAGNANNGGTYSNPLTH